MSGKEELRPLVTGSALHRALSRSCGGAVGVVSVSVGVLAIPWQLPSPDGGRCAGGSWAVTGRVPSQLRLARHGRYSPPHFAQRNDSGDSPSSGLAPPSSADSLFFAGKVTTGVSSVCRGCAWCIRINPFGNRVIRAHYRSSVPPRQAALDDGIEAGRSGPSAVRCNSDTKTSA